MPFTVTEWMEIMAGQESYEAKAVRILREFGLRNPRTDDVDQLAHAIEAIAVMAAVESHLDESECPLELEEQP